MRKDPITASNALNLLKKCPFCKGGGFEITLQDQKVKLTHWCENKPDVSEETMSITAPDFDGIVASWNSITLLTT